MSEPERFRDRFWDIVCEYQDLMVVGLAMVALFFALLLVVFPALAPGSASYIIAVVDLVLLVPLLVTFVFLIWTCRRRRPGPRF